MPVSARFTLLENRINDLEKNLLPSINPTGNYLPKEIDSTKGYCLLCHAEIECYLEDILLEVVKSIFEEWKKNKTMIHLFIFNLACNHKLKIDKKDTPQSLVHLSYKALEETIKGNNGIKEHNIENLFNPIDYQLDNTLIIALQGFGSTRGDIAHQSFQTHKIIDPQTEKTNISAILKGLEAFDLDFFQFKI